MALVYDIYLVKGICGITEEEIGENFQPELKKNGRS